MGSSKTLIIYTDGGSRNNPGEAGSGAVLYEGDTLVGEVSEYLGIKTNNWAEYQAIILSLQKAHELGYDGARIDMRMDSKLAVEQLSGNWKIKEPSIREQIMRVRALLPHFESVTFTHVRREFNKEADALANQAMDRGQNV